MTLIPRYKIPNWGIQIFRPPVPNPESLGWRWFATEASVARTPPAYVWRTLADGPEMACLATDAVGRTVWCNPGFEILSGYTLEALRGRKPGELLQCDATDPETVERLRAQLRARMPARADLLNRHRSGRLYWVRLTVIPSFDRRGVLQGFVGLHADLSDEVAARQQEQLRQDAMAAHFSHEVRAPIHAILNLLELLHDEALSAQQAEWVVQAIEAARGLQQMSESMLSRVKQLHLEGGGRPATVDPVALVKRVASVGRAYQTRPGVALQTVCEPGLAPVAIDEDRVYRVLLNLVSNALKFTRRGSVTLGLEVQGAPDGLGPVRLCFWVTDTGPGLSSEDQARIWRPYEQLHGDGAPAGTEDEAGHRSLAYTGTGLGLPLCEQMLGDMGSTLRLGSVPGRGSCFWFEITAEAAPRDDPPPPPPVQALDETSLQGWEVLLVEDNPVARRFTQQQLERLGARVWAAADGPSALSLLGDAGVARRVDIVLTDVHMAPMDGWTLARTLKADPRWSDLLVVGLTGVAESEGLDQAQEAGMAACLSKPFRVRELSRVLHRLRADRLSTAPAPRPLKEDTT